MDEARDLVILEGISRSYRREGEMRLVLNQLDCRVQSGVALGIQGASGSGKTTLARIMVGLDRSFEGRRILDHGLDPRRVQMVFQDSLQAFNPRLPLSVSLRESLVASEGTGWLRRDSAGVRNVLERALTEVGLDAHLLRRTPGRLSGGQRQRAAIARALLMRPAVLVLDEPVAALDPSIQAKILNVLQRVREDYGIALVIISHDPNVLLHMCEAVYTLEEGKLCAV
ncbi:MAG: ATP-binding cassette domain-containing protein [Spirochaetaceae bacterium]|nr:MAG: ATP-binding cassette domain-containing protein [Spirochaetaceae bacterium]